ncbi:MAG: EAL domain-containing protein [Sphingomonadaceae bacterium]|jgi:diguanylate cyclase (GGDEF)-like protein
MNILVCDDDSGIIETYRRVFGSAPTEKTEDALSSLADELFGPASEAQVAPAQRFIVTYATQGLDAVAQVEASLARNDPFRVAFIDVRMPPGIDGKETARRIRALDPNINIVIVTAYSDHSATDISAVAGPADKIFYICKPFSPDEVMQMATALCQRWDHDTRQIELLREKVNQLAESEARAQHIANHDFLTGAPNRMAFLRALTERVARDDTNFALAFMDLDRFKFVNDTFGHAAGDELLQTVYQTLRATAPEHTLVSRLGGDEFALMFEAADERTAQCICEKLVQSCAGGFFILGHSMQISASCGMLMARDYPEREANELMRYADIALFAAKRAGRDQVRVFDTDMDAGQKMRRAIEHGLADALEQNELRLHYQPIVERDGLKTVGFEALLRWHSEEYGNVSPALFIPIAEESMLIHSLGDWVIDRALQDCRSWSDQYVSINLSPRQFKHETIIERLVQRAAHWGVPHERIQIEITETAIFENIDHAKEMVLRLQQLGFRIALDDFGTGYSSLFNVKNFALDCIKIDKSFVESLGNDRHSAAIVNSVAHLARGLGLSIIAEGVETESQCQALRLVGCSHMQGYLFGAAMPVENSVRRIADESGDDAASANRLAS